MKTLNNKEAPLRKYKAKAPIKNSRAENFINFIDGFNKTNKELKFNKMI